MSSSLSYLLWSAVICRWIVLGSACFCLDLWEPSHFFSAATPEQNQLLPSCCTISDSFTSCLTTCWQLKSSRVHTGEQQGRNKTRFVLLPSSSTQTYSASSCVVSDSVHNVWGDVGGSRFRFLEVSQSWECWEIEIEQVEWSTTD